MASVSDIALYVSTKLKLKCIVLKMTKGCGICDIQMITLNIYKHKQYRDTGRGIGYLS